MQSQLASRPTPSPVPLSLTVPYCRPFPTFRFIQADLEAVDRTVTPWLIVGGHRPFYVSSTYKGPKDSDISVADDLRAALEDLFLKHQASDMDPLPCGRCGNDKPSVPFLPENCS